MNPKTAQNLDPRLKETYEKVMGTTVSPLQSSPLETSSQASQKIVAVKKIGASPVLIAVSAVLFLLVYALVWIILFGLKLPFLP
ncbi:MAG: hypothetical protein A2958_02295 [Candidatus Levybacteria bacterium RIFCSPLOWO2_01_FULL_38_13]|nr:MAG: hypothetical protein A2629_03925 [Candidatus Levybacteria bacterium RIFCSPHIGHO2_01_FULL_41_15]OGH35080.1 MAG: hypothetical protein A2958_02295 [Candidatus Levybacteria bacterium RIFCSPLOWO2_01_FULL_38_13]